MQGIAVTLEELLALRHQALQLHLPNPKVSTHSQHGSYHSPFRGRGMDFLENRIYQPGDDIRSINWAVTARTGKAHTKIYQQERERPIYIVIDFNDSMFFGTHSAYKSVVAARIAALLAWAALQKGDKVGALLIKDATDIVQPCHGKQNFYELLKKLVTYSHPENNGSSQTASGINKLKRLSKSGSLIYVLSDFYSLSQAVEVELIALSKYNDITNLFIYDPLEKEPPSSGNYLVHDTHKKQSFRMDTGNKQFCAKYKAIFQERLNRVKALSYKHGMQLAEVVTNGDTLKLLRRICNNNR